MDKKQTKITPRKKRAVLIEIPQDYADRLSHIAYTENRSTKAQAEVIVMRFLDSLNGVAAVSRQAS